MKRAPLSSIVLFTLGMLAPAAVLSCGGVAAELGTETGNPPVLDKLRLRLEVWDSGVVMIGEPGAVSPGGARVTVRNLSSGETTTVTAAANGSFRAELGGGLEDGYEVTVSAGGMDTSTDIDAPEVTGGSDGSGPPVVCDATPILRASCGASACHGAGSPFSDFAASETSPAMFVDVSPTASCVGSGLIIDSENPDASLLLTKLGNSPPCGAPMPLGTPGSLADEELSCLIEWLGSFQRED